jgi:hypothetical protein
VGCVMDVLTELLLEKRKAEARLKALVRDVRTSIADARSYGSDDTRAGREEAAERVDRVLQHHLRVWAAEDAL